MKNAQNDGTAKSDKVIAIATRANLKILRMMIEDGLSLNPDTMAKELPSLVSTLNAVL